MDVWRSSTNVNCRYHEVESYIQEGENESCATHGKWITSKIELNLRFTLQNFVTLNVCCMCWMTDWGDAAKLQYHCITSHIAVLLKRRGAAVILRMRNILRQHKQVRLLQPPCCSMEMVLEFCFLSPAVEFVPARAGPSVAAKLWRPRPIGLGGSVRARVSSGPCTGRRIVQWLSWPGPPGPARGGTEAAATPASANRVTIIRDYVFFKRLYAIMHDYFRLYAIILMQKVQRLYAIIS